MANKSILIFSKNQNSTQLEAQLKSIFEFDFSLVELQICDPQPVSICVKLIFNNKSEAENKSAYDEFVKFHKKLSSLKLDYFVLTQDYTNLKLAMFDMDSTLIQAEVMDELARAYGVFAQVSKITEEAMQGNLDFNQSFTKRLAMLKDMPTANLEKIRNNIKLSNGAEILFNHLNKQQIVTVLVSGGFDYFASFFAEKLDIKEFHANILQARNNKLTGEPVLPILDSSFKLRLLQQKVADLQIETKQILAVGDGANDIPMLQNAGFGIAYNAKPLVQEKVEFKLNFNDLDALSYLLYLD